MNPWSIIGWVIVALIALVFALYLLRIAISILRMVSEYIKYLTTRNDVPRENQLWRSHNNTLYSIQHVADNGRITIRTGNASTSYTPEEWKRAVRNIHLRRVSRT